MTESYQNLVYRKKFAVKIGILIKNILDFNRVFAKNLFTFIKRHTYKDVSQSAVQETELFLLLLSIQFYFIVHRDQVSHNSNLILLPSSVY